MFDFLKKKPETPDPAKPAATATVPPPARGFSPDDLARAFTASQEEKAARAEAEQAQAREAMKETLSTSLFARSIGSLFSRNPKLDDDLLDEIETALISADVGVPATTELLAGLRRRMKAREFADARGLFAALRIELLAMLAPVSKPLVIDGTHRPFTILTVGVNGVGKTTTIGKLARRFQEDGHSLMLAAGDTFRAAAVEQLKVWGERNNVVVIAQGQNADAASVAFDAVQAAKARDFDVLVIDTAGRLHTQTGLMAELGKIRRVITKVDAGAPHEVLLVIDGTTGPERAQPVARIPPGRAGDRPGRHQARRHREGRRGVRPCPRVRHPHPVHWPRRETRRPAHFRSRGLRGRAPARNPGQLMALGQRGRRWLRLLLVAGVLLAIGAWWIDRQLEPQRLTATVLKKAGEALKLDLRYTGDADYALKPEPRLLIPNLEVRDPRDQSLILSARRAEVSLPWDTLTGGEPVITRIELDAPGARPARAVALAGKPTQDAVQTADLDQGH